MASYEASEELPGEDGPVFLYAGKRPETNSTIKCYLGTGPLAAVVACFESEKRAARHKFLADLKQDRERIIAAGKLAEEATAAAKQYMATALNKLGYHQHDRGVWRKNRQGFFKSLEIDALPTTEPVFATINEAIQQTLLLLEGLPDEIFQARLADILDLSHGLLRDGDSDLEQVCAARIVLSTLQVYVLRMQGLKWEGITKAHAKFLLKRLHVEKRHLTSAKAALEAVRRILERESGVRRV
jgi:hypothetical protein